MLNTDAEQVMKDMEDIKGDTKVMQDGKAEVSEDLLNWSTGARQRLNEVLNMDFPSKADFYFQQHRSEILHEMLELYKGYAVSRALFIDSGVHVKNNN